MFFFKLYDCLGTVLKRSVDERQTALVAQRNQGQRFSLALLRAANANAKPHCCFSYKMRWLHNTDTDQVFLQQIPFIRSLAIFG